MGSVPSGERLPVHTEPFAARVRTSHESWQERREVKALASAHDRDSQLRLLLALHRWATGAIEDIRSVYGNELPAEISPVPRRDDVSPAFTVSLGGSHVLTLSLLERRRLTVQHWYVSVSYSSAATGGEGVMAGPERRNGQWTRGRLEDLLLSILGSYERSFRSAGPAEPGAPSAPRRGTSRSRFDVEDDTGLTRPA